MRSPLPAPSPRHTAAALVLCIGLPIAAARADEVPRALATRFTELAQRAETAFNQAGPGAAIHVYESGLAGLGEDYGRLHLRLGQLYQQLGQSPESAQHYKACMVDKRVESIDRELICEDGLKSVTAPVQIVGLPADASVLVVEPAAFAGPLRDGDRLPLGSAHLQVEATGHGRREATLRVTAPKTLFQVELGPAFTDAEDAGPDGHRRGRHGADDSTPGFGHWGSVLTGGTGAALLATGLVLGFMNRGTLDDLRAKQGRGGCGANFCRGELDSASSRGHLSDGLWIGGAGLTTVGVGLWLFIE